MLSVGYQMTVRTAQRLPLIMIAALLIVTVNICMKVLDVDVDLGKDV